MKPRAFRDFLPPEKLELVIKMAQRCASPLPWEPDNNKANEKVFELWTALKSVKSMALGGELCGEIDKLQAIVEPALASAQQWEMEEA